MQNAAKIHFQNDGMRSESEINASLNDESPREAWLHA